MSGVRIPVEGRPILLFSGYREPFPGIRRPGRLVNHSPLCSNEVKIEWSYTSLPPICLRRVDRESSLLCRLYCCTPGTWVRYQTFILWEKCWWLLANRVAQFLSDWAAGWTTFPGTCKDFFSSPNISTTFGAPKMEMDFVSVCNGHIWVCLSLQMVTETVSCRNVVFLWPKLYDGRYPLRPVRLQPAGGCWCTHLILLHYT
jgi:hypothetical protein